METQTDRINMVKTAIVILNWNGLPFLKKFIGNIIENSMNGESLIYVADNGSTDGSAHWLASNHKGVNIIKLDKNYGFAEGYNKALEGIEAKYYLLLNSDIEVTPGWLDKLVGFMDAHPEVASAQPKTHAFDNKEKFEYAGAAGGFLDRYGYPVCRGRVFHVTENDKGQYDTPWEIFWATGACTIIRSDAWKKCGGFDGDFFAHMEEIDLCWRFHRAGYKVALVESAVVYHVGGGTLPYNSPFKTYLNFRNGLFLLYKNLPATDLKRIMFIRMVLDGVAFFFFLFKLQFSSALAVIKAHIHYHREKKNLVEKRKKTMALGTVHPAELFIDKSIVWEFYVKGKKSFNEINQANLRSRR